MRMQRQAKEPVPAQARKLDLENVYEFREPLLMPADSETQVLLRRELWFRQFSRVGAPQDRDAQNAVAEKLHREAGRQQEKASK